MARALSRTTLKLCFRRLIAFGNKEKKYLQLVGRKV